MGECEIEQEQNAPAAARRLDSIDILRAVAILLMVQVHFTEILSYRISGKSILYEVSATLGAVSAPLFVFLVGISLYLSASRQEEFGRTPQEMCARNWRRGIFIFFAGLVFNVLIWTPEGVFNWDILTFIGAAILVVYPLRKLSPSTLLLIALAILLVSPALRSVSGFAAHWHGYDEYVYRFTLKDVTLGFLLNGYFPLLPWLAFPISGLATAKLFLRGGRGKASRSRALPVAGLGLMGLSAVGTVSHRWVGKVPGWYLSPREFYPATTTFILGALGIILLLFWALHRWVDNRPGRDSRAFRFFRRYSRFSLTTYVVHNAVLVWPLFLAAVLADRKDPWYFYEGAFSAPVALLLAAAYIAVFCAVIVVWDRHGSLYSLEWFEHRFTG